MTPRFSVGSVTGFPIGKYGSAGFGLKEKTFWYVHDSAFCYQEVAHFTGYSGELHARALAARLNALDLLDWPPRLELTA
jgi:hypothetical protein